MPQFSEPIELGRGILVPCSEFIIEDISEEQLENHDKKILVVLTGGIYPEVQKAVRSILLENGYADLYILRFIKPIDEKYFLNIAKKYYGVVFVEDGVKIGGICEYLQKLLMENNITNTVLLGFEDKFINHGTRDEILEMTGLSVNHIKKAIKKCSR